MKTIKHWTRYLPEFGRHYIVDSIEKKLRNIEELKQRIKVIEQEVRDDERELVADHIKPNWEQNEIDRAKSDAKSKSNQ
ncbi:MAG: hypothetical protein JWO03_900 [Bacteroidetes bacterium]|nr:hypothetical protein [Bacteroidota bacterium]